MSKDVFAVDAFNAINYPPTAPKAPDPCAALRKQLNKNRPGWMVGQEKYKNFLTTVAAQILSLAPAKGISFYGALFIIAHSATETQYGTNAGAKKYNNYWGHRRKGKVDVDYSNLTFSGSFDKYLEYFEDAWPEMLTLLKGSIKVVVDPLAGPSDYDYYFTAEELNQVLNSGKYGGNGSGDTFKIVTKTTRCYNAEFYTRTIDYGPSIFRVLTKFVFDMIEVTSDEISQLAQQTPPCEADVLALTDSLTQAKLASLRFNMKWIKDKDYGYYMPIDLVQAGAPVNPITDATGEPVSRPATNMVDRLIPNNEKNVTIPAPID